MMHLGVEITAETLEQLPKPGDPDHLVDLVVIAVGSGVGQVVA
jgi:hypothetical protein